MSNSIDGVKKSAQYKAIRNKLIELNLYDSDNIRMSLPYAMRSLMIASNRSNTHILELDKDTVLNNLNKYYEDRKAKAEESPDKKDSIIADAIEVVDIFKKLYNIQ